MQFDDRLATVLRMQTGSERAAHTQFRQLLDLAGSAPAGTEPNTLKRVIDRLEALSEKLDLQHRAAMIREPGTRLRNPRLVGWLAKQELPIASAAMSRARLDAAQWDKLIPQLPIPARALLRHRQDLPKATQDLLARLGVRDLVLPEPPTAQQEAAAEAESDGAEILSLDPALEAKRSGKQRQEEKEGIGAIVRRIEAFQRARHEATSATRHDSPRLPLDEKVDEAAQRLPRSVDFTTDTEGRISWADSIFAPMLVGMALASEQPEAPARADSAVITAMRRRQPVRSGALTLEGAPLIAGEWRIDATPHFTSPGGRYAGYRGRLRRPISASCLEQADRPDSQADRMRQIVHELRTPVNAIQGFAEIIQQQLFGPTPNEYRALAASIAGDAARMLAGFDELDRLVKLETGALELEEGLTDMRPIVAATVHQLDRVLRARSAGLELKANNSPCPIAVSQSETEVLVWRILATLAASASPGEALHIALSCNGQIAQLEVELPASLAGQDDLFGNAAPAKAQAVSAGMFGAGFTLRLARAEARAVHGDLERQEDWLALTVPTANGEVQQDPGENLGYRDKLAKAG